jgi:hypothetical protein
MIETMELLGDKKFVKALEEYESGKMKFKDFDEVFGEE